ncbi:MAG: adenylyl-sulfate kinase [Opitutae bacterium]|nr:adenylyl-sulfate kinase [Opitutae bacterium]
MNESDIHPITDRLISRGLKEKLLGQKGVVFWLYGLSGSGKSTLAIEMENRLHQENIHSVVLDGDNLRSGLNSDLGFSNQDRAENIRRVSEIAKLFSTNGIITLVSLISPLREFRDKAKSIIGEDHFHEIFIKASYSTCKERDVKGLYAKAEKGMVQSFTGQDSEFEEPETDCLMIDSENENLQQSADLLYKYIRQAISLT